MNENLCSILHIPHKPPLFTFNECISTDRVDRVQDQKEKHYIFAAMFANVSSNNPRLLTTNIDPCYRTRSKRSNPRRLLPKMPVLLLFLCALLTVLVLVIIMPAINMLLVPSSSPALSSSSSSDWLRAIRDCHYSTATDQEQQEPMLVPPPLLLLDGLLDPKQIIDLNNACPAERKLVANASEPFDKFIDNVFARVNNSVHEPFQRPIKEIADRFHEIVHGHFFLTRGFWAEFGVYQGSSMKYASDRLLEAKDEKGKPLFQGVLAGFDSFEGLPEKWRRGFEKGMFGKDNDLYSTVRSLLPSQVELHKGWFQNTIGPFKDKYPRMPAALIHHDGDLFLSTAITFHLLADRIVPGTHMVFDELFGYNGYENHEILALYLWMVQNDAVLCAMGHKSYIDKVEYQKQKDQHPDEQSAWFQVLSLKKK
jgi:hypothetical protein